MDTATMTVQDAIQAKIAATEAYDAIVYGERALQAAGGKAYGCTTEWGAAGWMIEQFETGWLEATIAIDADDLGDIAQAGWVMKRGKKIALEAKREAVAAVKELGNARQLRLALAA